MDWLSILQQIFELCIIPLLGIVTKFVIEYIAQKKEQIKTQTDNELAQKYLDILNDTIAKCVTATNQTYVESLKEQNAFDADAQKAIVPCKKDKKGALATGGAHLSTAQFDLLGDYAVDIATKGASEIANGYIKPSPIAKEKCKRCDFASICAYKEKFERKAPKVKGIESFEKEGEDNE